MSASTYLAVLRLERALMALERRLVDREPTRSERRLAEHYRRQLRALETEGV